MLSVDDFTSEFDMDEDNARNQENSMRIITVEPGSSEEQSQPRKLQFAPDASEHMKNSMLDDFDAGMSEE